jgi:hypothetical protein
MTEDDLSFLPLKVSKVGPTDLHDLLQVAKGLVALDFGRASPYPLSESRI